MTPRELIDRMRAPEIARRLGLRRESVWAWSARGRIPREHIQTLRQMAAEAGIELTERDVLGLLGVRVDAS